MKNKYIKYGIISALGMGYITVFTYVLSVMVKAAEELPPSAIPVSQVLPMAFVGGFLLGAGVVSLVHVAVTPAPKTEVKPECGGN